MSITQGILSGKYTHCLFCENEFSDDRPPTKDHFIPMSKGGSKGSANIYVVCKPCNHMKGNFMPYEFRYWLRLKITWKESVISQGVAYSFEELTTIKKNVAAIYNNGNIIPRKETTVIVKTTETKTKNKTSIVGSYLTRHYGSPNVPKQTKIKERQSEQEKMFLQTQTVEQFKERKRLDVIVDRMLKEPEPNFHIPE